MEKERSIYLDVLKAVTIFLVLLGHCIQYGAGAEYMSGGVFLYNPVFIFIYSFHMPLFTIISGYLFACSCKTKSNKQLLTSKVKQVIIPLFCWSFISLIVEIVKSILKISAHKVTIIWIGQTILSAFIHGPWFLWAIWWGSFIVIIGRRFLKDNILFYLAICLILLVVPDDNNIAVYKFVFPYFVLAYLFNSKNFVNKFKKVYMHFAFIIACVVAFVVLLPKYNFDTYIYTTGYSIINKNVIYQLHNNSFRFVIGLVGSFSIMYLVYAIVKIIPKAILTPFVYVGKNTLGIYLISNYFFDEILKRMAIPGLNFWYILAEFVCVLGASLLINAILKKFKITNKLFLGGR